MYALLLLGFASFVLSLVLTPLTRNAFRFLGIVDRPDHGRKLHDCPIPRVGGIPIALAYLGAFAILFASSFRASILVRGALPLAWRLLPAAGFILAIGLLDDLIGLKARTKLLGQLAAAALAISAGFQIAYVGGHHVALWLGIPLTMIWLIGCTNAFNLIDGIDGLATGAGFFATVTILLAALANGNIELALATIPLAGALLGFLRYNFNPASIFLGDSGSLLIGFLLGCYGIHWSQKSATILGMTAPLMALAIPLLDTGLAIVRRFLRQQPILAADRGHIHHRLLARGITPQRVTLLLYGACGVAATFSLLQNSLHGYFGSLVVILFCGAAWVGVQHLGYAEFGLAGRMLMGGEFRRLLNAQLSVRNFQEALREARTAPEVCQAVLNGCREFGFHRVELCFLGNDYLEQSTNNDGEALGNEEWTPMDEEGVNRDEDWTIHVRLSDSDFIRLHRQFQSSLNSEAIVPFVEVIQSTLKEKLEDIATLTTSPLAAAAAVGAEPGSGTEPPQ